MELIRKLGTKFNLDNFYHKAFFNEEKKRIEMHLVSKENQSISQKRKKLKF